MNKRFIYLAKLGIFEGTDQLGKYKIQRIDSPSEFQEHNNLKFLPQQLDSDAEALACFNSITHSKLMELEVEYNHVTQISFDVAITDDHIEHMGDLISHIEDLINDFTDIKSNPLGFQCLGSGTADDGMTEHYTDALVNLNKSF